MCVPFEPGTVDERRPANGDLADIIWQRVFGSDGSQECVPAYDGVSEMLVGGDQGIPSAILGAWSKVRSRGISPIAPLRAFTRSRTSWSSGARSVGGLGT